MSVPMYTTLFDKYGDEPGQVVVYTGGSSFPTGTTNDALGAASWSALGTKNFGRFGAALAVWDWNNDGKQEIVCGEPRSLGLTGATEMAGSVHVFNAP